MPLWLLHTDLLNISHRGKLPICLLLFSAALISHQGWSPIWLPNIYQLLLALYPRRGLLPIWRLRISPHWVWMPLWLLHTDLSTITRQGKLTIWIILFYVALMTHRGWPPIWILNISQLLLALHPRWGLIPIWRLRISPHWGWLTLWLLYTALSNIPCQGKLTIWLLLFYVSLMPHQIWLPIWLLNTPPPSSPLPIPPSGMATNLAP